MEVANPSDAPVPDRQRSPTRSSHSSAAPRQRPRQRASQSSLKPSSLVNSIDEHSLTSFPSLSPSLEYSPEQVHDKDARPLAADLTPPASPTKITPTALQDLFVPLGEDADRSNLFYDGPRDIRDVPGTLHLQTDDSISHLIQRTGAVKLVKQLSADLAQRDAHVTLVQRKAEEREALLRKMLRECEVSNLDIENRLRELDRSRAASSVRSGKRGTTGNEDGNTLASIDERMQQALSDELQAVDEVSADDRHQGVGMHDRSARSTSIASADPSRGWKTLFRGTKRASVSQHQPSDLHDTHFDSGSTRTNSRTPSTTSTRERGASLASSDTSASSISMAAWALRMVAGNAQANGPAQDDSNSPSKANRGPRASVPNGTTGTMKKLGSDARSARDFGTVRGPQATLRSLPSETSQQLLISHSSQALLDGGSTNLGPVEMDTILPEDTRPPTLLQPTSQGEFLTDNFGFIYDQRRRRKVNEAAAAMPRNKRGSMVESLKNHRVNSGLPVTASSDALSISSATSHSSRPTTANSADGVATTDAPKRWQDYLKLSSLKTELLSHTPSPGPITDITTSEPDSNKTTLATITMSKRGSEPAVGKAPEPSATRIVSDNAELVHTASQPPTPGATSDSDIDPVKALVEHLSEVHESAQREKTHRWNDFLRKVRADRRKDFFGKVEQKARSKGDMPETLLTDGEVIGIAGLGVRGKVGRAKGNEFRQLVLAGVPTSYRSKIWAECSGALSMRVPGYYEDLTNSPFTDETIVQQIQMDITRTLTDNIYYRRGAGVDKLKEVLLAYARRNPDIGYCQGMNLITANLLLILPTAEDVFWVLTSMIENIIPEGYYSPSLLTSRADQVVLRQYVADILPSLSKHLEDLNIELEALTFQWFLSVFTDCLSAEALFRVWDVVLCLPDVLATAPKPDQPPPRGAATFLFQVALALLKLNEQELITCDNPAEIYRYINRGMTDHAISIDNLIRASEALRREVRVEDVLQRRRVAVEDELDLMRKREAIRKGKGRAVDPPPAPPAPTTPTLELNGIAEGDRTPRPKKHLRRQPSRAELDEEREALEYSELQVRTPMPIDEEVEWRA